ncbi:hypothetical protein BJ912DRAFT_1015360 [Pholiota molesta]|nr:hypothetical protein BJ912DRAFT_1015360 [Pholiota molesta]
MVNFPAPVGGTPFRIDFAPSLIFAVLYAALVPLMVFRMLSRRSRSILLIGNFAFSVERSSYHFRFTRGAIPDERRRLSPSLATYMQISFGIGFIGIASDIANLVRCLLVNATYGPSTYGQSSAASSKGGLMDAPQWVRRGSGIVLLLFFGAIIPGFIANWNYNQTFNNQQQADTSAILRYVSTAIALALIVVLLTATLLGKLYLPRICDRGVLITCAMTVLVSIMAIYRLAIMWRRTISLAAFSPLDTTNAKAAFYIFHVLPEWLVTLILFGDNARKTYGTGLFGDWRIRDESDEQRQKREMKEVEKEKRHIPPPQDC